MPKVSYPYEVNGKFVTENCSLISIYSLSNCSLVPSLTVLCFFNYCGLPPKTNHPKHFCSECIYLLPFKLILPFVTPLRSPGAPLDSPATASVMLDFEGLDSSLTLVASAGKMCGS